MISMDWVKDYVDLENIDLKELADKITKAGVNVEGVISNHIDNLVVGYVESCIKHPDSDHLNICKVNVGDSIKQIVCGASNVREGIKVIVALPGAVLPGDFEIKKSKIRGVESNGMICALFELGLEEKNEKNYNKGIEELDKDAPIGMDAIKYLGLDDTVYNLDLNPNRNIDCTNHIGFAYEVASVLGKNVKMPSIKTNPINESIIGKFDVKVDTPNCTMYNAKIVKDVVIGQSPEFIKNRLIAAGMRPINNVVDISNYVMLEYGQPLHFFDKDKLGDKIVVRMAKDEESIVTLDRKTRVLSKDDIVITDGDKPVCIAGVMGGENTEVDENTKDILIEAAIFNPYNVRYTSINLDLRSEASLRYERGLNYEYTNLALERACHLLEKYASGKVLSDTITYDNTNKEVKKATVTLKQVNSMLGMTLTNDDVKHSLDNLGFKYENKNDEYLVTIPNRRIDVESNAADLVEEIGRLYGYDKIVGVLPVGNTKPGKYVGNIKYRKLLSNRLRALGLNESRTYTLISEEDDKLFNYNRHESIKLLKPMSQDKSVVRQSIIPSLLKVVDYNKARNIKDIMLYEISNVYYDEDKEETKVCIALSGSYMKNNWLGTNVKVDFYLLKGIIENILEYFGFKNRYEFVVGNISNMHPGVSAEILLDKKPIGFFGKVHPSIRKDDVYVAEISLNEIINKKVRAIKHKEVSKYPEVNKDVAFIVKKDVPAESIIHEIKKSGGKLLTDIDVFDVYVGDNVNEDEKSIAFSLTFQDQTKTLNDEEIMQVFNKIISNVEKKLKAKLRG